MVTNILFRTLRERRFFGHERRPLRMTRRALRAYNRARYRGRVGACRIYEVRRKRARKSVFKK
jgi:hypothetical protein